jgi:starch phosphorylase
MHNIQLFNVAPAIPEALQFLEVLARNLWWSWKPGATDLFRRIDPQLWKDTGHNPLRFFSRIPQKRFEALTQTEGFMSHYEEVKQEFEEELGIGHDGMLPRAPSDAIAYFSLEYGIHESVRLYAGGLGCLAGDHLKAASDAKVPLVCVGLLYRQGYFQQYLNEDGWQQEAYVECEMQNLPVRPVLNDKQEQVEIGLTLPDGTLKAVVWQLDVGRVPLYLLDANIGSNPPHYRHITAKLYEGDREIRLRQELLLGIGGYRALRLLGYDPPVCHMNEGHAGFLSLGRVEDLVRHRNLDVKTALQIAQRTDVFTTHTPVPAGNETFPADLVLRHLNAMKDELDVLPEQIMAWGRPDGADANAEFSMTVMGLRMAAASNAVSHLHGVVARKMWAHLWPHRPIDEIPINHVTNGVHVCSWLSPDNATLFERYLGREWWAAPADIDMISRIEQIPDEELWHAHELGRSRLVRAARELGEKQFSMRNESRQEISRIRSVLQHDVLTIGFARRFAEYKRATLLLKDPDRLAAILTNEERPVQMVFAGKAHPADNGGKDLIRQIIHFARNRDIRHRMIFLEDYDIATARYLVQGVDVWLNNPRRPQEASGTSGMKAAVNGAIHVSTLDGWWDEGYSPECGWAIGDGEEYSNHDYQDTIESQALYNILENELIPCYYDRQPGDVPRRWVKMMRASIKNVLETFTSDRMVREYLASYYEPAKHAWTDLLHGGATRARGMVTQEERLKSLWKKVKVAMPQADHDLSDLHVGDRFQVTVRVDLDGLNPDEVDVEIYYGTVTPSNEITDSTVTKMEMIEKAASGKCVYRQEVFCKRTGRYGFTVRVTPQGSDWKGIIPGFITWAGNES